MCVDDNEGLDLRSDLGVKGHGQICLNSSYGFIARTPVSFLMESVLFSSTIVLV